MPILRNKLFLAALFLVLLVSCRVSHRVQPYGLQDGDLLFVVDGGSGFSEAITQATWREEGLSFSHVAIGFRENGAAYIIEASPENGVAVQSLQEFLAKAPAINGRPAIVVKRLIDYPRHLKQQAVERAHRHIGEPYDWSFLADNGKMYCSELVYESFRTADGEPLFEAYPMNFLAPDSTLPAFWRRLFDSLGESVPQGLPGTNPNRLSQDDWLIEIFSFLGGSIRRF